jgi:Bacterial regulatory helix-turn-helix protein, lysR family
MIENRHLRYITVLARTLHMTRAAEQLHIVQPALTQNIQQLEEELGTLLIHREGRKLSLTEAGEVFLAEAERSLQQFELAKIAAQRRSAGDRVAETYCVRPCWQYVPSLGAEEPLSGSRRQLEPARWRSDQRYGEPNESLSTRLLRSAASTPTGPILFDLTWLSWQASISLLRKG